MAFEVFQPRRSGRKGTSKKGPLIRLSKNSLVLNKWAREILNSETIELAYDPETNTIRVSPNGNITLKKTKAFAKGFFKAFDIKASGSFPVEVNEGSLFAQIS